MFERTVENLCKVTDSTIQMQQELLKKWTTLLSTVPAAATAIAEPLAFQRKGLEIVGEVFKKEYEMLEAQFSACARNFNEAFQLVNAKDPEEFRTKTAELWQQGFEGLRLSSETHVRDFKQVAGMWTELVTKGAA